MTFSDHSRVWDNAPTKSPGACWRGWQEVAELTSAGPGWSSLTAPTRSSTGSPPAGRGRHLQEAERKRSTRNSYLGAVRPVPNVGGASNSRDLHLFRGARSNAGPTNNWMEPPAERCGSHHGPSCYRGCMRGPAPCGVVPFLPWGPLRRRRPESWAVEITDSEVRRGVDEGDDPDGQGPAPGEDRRRRVSSSRRCTSGGGPRWSRASPNRVPVAVQRHQVHHPLPPRPREDSGSYGSGLRRATPLLGKKCYSLAHCFRRWPTTRVWLAEHMLISSLISPEKQGVLLRRSLPVGVWQDQPWRCWQPTIPGLARRDPG